MPRVVTELAKRFRTEIREFVLFPATPQIFDRVQLRRVGRQPLELETITLCCDEFLDHLAAVARKPIPDDEKLAR